MLEPMTRQRARWRHEDLREARATRQGAIVMVVAALAVAVALIVQLAHHPDVLWTVLALITVALAGLFAVQDLRASSRTRSKWFR